MMLALMLMGGVSAFAQEEGEKVYATFENPQNTQTAWDAETRIFSWTATSYNQLRNIGLPNGNITEYATLGIDCEFEEGNKFRILIYKGGDNKVIWVTNPGVSEFNLIEAVGGDMEFLTNCTEICLSGPNWEGQAPGQAKINSVYLVKATDPLATPKKALSDALTLAKMQSDFGKTTESFAALTQAIADGEAAYSAEDATEESLYNPRGLCRSDC